MATIVEMAETIRALREQVKDRNTRLAEDPGASELIELGEKFVADLDAVEEKIHNPHAEVDYDILGGRHGGAMLYSRLSWLFYLSADHDGPPTQGMREVAADTGRELAEQESVFSRLLSEDLAKLNETASELDVPYVLTPAAR